MIPNLNQIPDLDGSRSPALGATEAQARHEAFAYKGLMERAAVAVDKRAEAEYSVNTVAKEIYT